MRPIDILRLRLRSLFQRRSLERELDEEIRLHLDLQIEQNIAAGMSPEAARSAALLQFGGAESHKDACRDARGTTLIQNFFEDARHALRGLKRDPFLACTAAATLAICIGANTTVFSMADSILIRPLPYPHAERIDWISERSGPTRDEIAAAPDYFRLRDQNRIFESVAIFQPLTLNWTGVDRPEQLDAANVSVSFFRVMGSPPLLGRTFVLGEEGPKAPRIAVLSYDFWRNRLGSDPHILGKTVALDRLPRTVIGVMPQGFDFPHGTQVWLPDGLDEAANRQLAVNRPIRIVSMLARRSPQITPQQADAEMRRLTTLIRADYQIFKALRFRTDVTIEAPSLQQHLTSPLRPALLVLTGAVGLVLLIACVNLANLLLSRAASRQRAFAVRLALGSGRSRIIRQMLTESLVLALPGAVAGIAIAAIAVRALDAAKPSVLVRYPPISMDWRVLLFTVAVTLLTTLLFGSAPAWFAAGIPIHETLKSSGATHSGARGAVRVRKLLLVGELAISLVLLIGAGLLLRSFVHLARTELGFRSDHLLTFRANAIGPLDRDYTRFFLQILDRLKAVPGVQSAALTSDLPLNDLGTRYTGRVQVQGHPPVPVMMRPLITAMTVSPEFFHTLEIPLRDGRIFEPRDAASSSDAVVLSEAFVRRNFPNEDPIGRRLVFGGDQNHVTWTVIGVVGDIRGAALGADPPPLIYRCTCAGWREFGAFFALRTAADPKAVVRDAEAAVRSIDRDQPIFDVKTMDERRDDALAPARFQLILIGTFAAIAIVLVIAGIYGVLSYLVARRTREIGIRVALGARPAAVWRTVVGESAALTCFAILAGGAGAWALTRYLKSMLYGVTELDAATFAAAPLLLAVIAALASLGPARRAARVDPVTALKDE